MLKLSFQCAMSNKIQALESKVLMLLTKHIAKPLKAIRSMIVGTKRIISSPLNDRLTHLKEQASQENLVMNKDEST